MVTIIQCSVVGTETVFKYKGKSTDEKPMSTNGSCFVEMDTGKEYFFDGDEKGWSEQADKYLDSIAIETAPTKTTYYVGDAFDATGAVVKAIYTDKSEAVVENFVVDAPQKLALDSEVALVYVENGRTRKAPVEIEIKSNEATDKDTFMDIVANGSSVVLEADIVATKLLNFDKDFVLDLNGHELSTTSNIAYLMNTDGAKLTIKGGKITTKKRIGQASNGGEIVIEDGLFTTTTDVAFASTGEGSKITFNGGELHAYDGGLMAFYGATVEMNGGKIFLTDNFVIGTNGSNGQGNNTIIINGGYLEGHIESAGFEAIGVYVANNDTFIMNDGEIFVENGAGVLMRGGNVTFNGGKIRCTGVEGGGGYVGDKKKVMSQSAIIYDEASNYPGKDGMNLTVNGGVFVGYDHSVEVLSNEAEPQVFINGGAFVPPYVPAD